MTDGENIDGYVIADGTGKMFRCWECGPAWTEDLDTALWFARQGDAEKFSEEDEDAWFIVRVSKLRQEMTAA